MRAFIVACLAALLIAVVAVASLGWVQRSAAAAYSTDGARINPSYTLKRAISRTQKTSASPGNVATPAADHAMMEECNVMTTWRQILIDLGLSGAPECLE